MSKNLFYNIIWYGPMKMKTQEKNNFTQFSPALKWLWFSMLESFFFTPEFNLPPLVPIWITLRRNVRALNYVLQDLVSTVERLNDYLETGCTRQQCVDIAEAANFDNLKQSKQQLYPQRFRARFKNNSPNIFRKGKVL